MTPTLYLAAAVAAGSLALGFGAGWKTQGWRAAGQIEALRAALERTQGEHARAVSAAASAALAQSEAHRATEAALRRRVQEADHARTQDRAALLSRAAAADRAAFSLRERLDAYTCTAAGSGTGDAGAASGSRSAALGDVLGEILRDYRQIVDAAEDHAASVRALLGAWPRSAVKP